VKRVLVCGGRKFAEKELAFAVLTELHRDEGIACIIHGCQSGADTIAALWAVDVGIPHQPFPAAWSRYGNAAGPIRNRQMIIEGKPDLVIAFPGGNGTADMVAQANRAAIPVYEIDFGEGEKR
jgi:predicted Rossmann-fold nucleotide-binding protein